MEKPKDLDIKSRLEQESSNIQELQNRWDCALDRLYEYFNIEKNKDDNENEKLREIETQTLANIEKGKESIVLGFAGPGGAGKGTVREQIKDPLATGSIVNSTTRDRRDYEIDGVHYNFVTTKELASKSVLLNESLEKVQELLELETIPKQLQPEHLDKLQQTVDEKFKLGELEDGIDLLTNTNDPKNEFLNLTLRPLRGWYALSIRDLQNSTDKNKISSFEESGPNLLRIGEGMKNQDINFYLVYVLPEQPIAETMATRALKRDGCDQDTEKLLSTIGGRQILEFEKMVQMLTSGEYATKLVLLVNDEGREEEGQFLTRTGDALINTLR